MKEGLTVDDVYDIIQKHKLYHMMEATECEIKGDELGLHCHASALATLKMIKMEMDGEREW